jgi:hypothetical protein
VRVLLLVFRQRAELLEVVLTDVFQHVLESVTTRPVSKRICG